MPPRKRASPPPTTAGDVAALRKKSEYKKRIPSFQSHPPATEEDPAAPPKKRQYRKRTPSFPPATAEDPAPPAKKRKYSKRTPSSQSQDSPPLAWIEVDAELPNEPFEDEILVVTEPGESATLFGSGWEDVKPNLKRPVGYAELIRHPKVYDIDIAQLSMYANIPMSKNEFEPRRQEDFYVPAHQNHPLSHSNFVATCKKFGFVDYSAKICEDEEMDEGSTTNSEDFEGLGRVGEQWKT